MACTLHFLLITALVLCVACVEAAPFFDAIYDAINGNSRRSYGYNGYGNYNYGYDNGYGSYGAYGHRHAQAAPRERQGKSYKEICRAHFPDSVAFPGSGGIVCPY